MSVIVAHPSSKVENTARRSKLTTVLRTSAMILAGGSRCSAGSSSHWGTCRSSRSDGVTSAGSCCVSSSRFSHSSTRPSLLESSAGLWKHGDRATLHFSQTAQCGGQVPRGTQKEGERGNEEAAHRAGQRQLSSGECPGSETAFGRLCRLLANANS